MEKDHVTYKGRPIQITPDFCNSDSKSQKSWTYMLNTIRDHKCQSGLLYSAKFSVIIGGKIRNFMIKPNLNNIYLQIQIYRRY